MAAGENRAQNWIWLRPFERVSAAFTGRNVVNLMFVDPCIIVKFIKKNPTRCNNLSKMYYSIFIWSSTCFGRHTAQYQEPKTALAASGFFTWMVVRRLVGGRCQAHCAWQRPPTTRLTTLHVWKTGGFQCSFRLLMMGGVSPKTRWASYKYEIIKFRYIIASCWIFLNGISWNLKLRIFTKTCREILNLTKRLHKIWGTAHEDLCMFHVVASDICSATFSVFVELLTNAWLHKKIKSKSILGFP